MKETAKDREIDSEKGSLFSCWFVDPCCWFRFTESQWLSHDSL